VYYEKLSCVVEQYPFNAWAQIDKATNKEHGGPMQYEWGGVGLGPCSTSGVGLNWAHAVRVGWGWFGPMQYEWGGVGLLLNRYRRGEAFCLRH